eukprot:g3057.t1
MSSLFNKALSVFLPKGYQPSSSPASPSSYLPASAAAAASERKGASSPAPVRVPVETPHRRRAHGAPQKTLRSAFELDVTMIHGQLMCMGMPRNLPTDKRGNHNNIDEIVSFLEHRFRDHYLIFNLTDKQYDYYKFKYQVLDKLVGARSKENDAVRSPTLQELFNICYAMEFWRSLHPENVAVLHCKNGKSCTRLVVAASLMFDGTCTTPEEALVLFYRKRLRRPLFGIDDLPRLIASAHDVLDAFGRLCISKSGVPPNAKPLMLNNLVMMGFPTDFEDQPAPVVELWKGNRQLFTSQGAGEADGYNRNAKLVQWDASGGVLVLQLACEVEGDILLVCRAIVDVGTAREPRDEERIVFQYSFHTGFLAAGAMRLARDKIDVTFRKSAFGDEFLLDLSFVSLKSPSSAMNSFQSTENSPKPNRKDGSAQTRTLNTQLGLRNNSARDAGLVWITQKHAMVPHEDVFRSLQKDHPCKSELAVFACQRMINDYSRCVELIQDFGDRSVAFGSSSSPKRTMEASMSSADIRGKRISEDSDGRDGNSGMDSAGKGMRVGKNINSPRGEPSSLTSGGLHPSLITPEAKGQARVGQGVVRSASKNSQFSHDMTRQGMNNGDAPVFTSSHNTQSFGAMRAHAGDSSDPRWYRLLEPFVKHGWDLDAPFVFLAFETVPPEHKSVFYHIIHGEGKYGVGEHRIWAQGHSGFIYVTDGKNAWDVVFQMPGATVKQCMAMMRTESKRQQYRYLSFQIAQQMNRRYLTQLTPDQRNGGILDYAVQNTALGESSGNSGLNSTAIGSGGSNRHNGTSTGGGIGQRSNSSGFAAGGSGHGDGRGDGIGIGFGDGLGGGGGEIDGNSVTTGFDARTIQRDQPASAVTQKAFSGRTQEELLAALEAAERRAAIAESSLIFTPLSPGQNPLDLHKKTYEMMLSAGIPKDNVRAKMLKDGVPEKDADAFLLAEGKNKERKKGKDAETRLEVESASAALAEKLKAQQKDSGVSSSSTPAIQDDPKYQPYLKMLKMGVPQQAVKHKMAKDGIDPAILDMDPTKPPTTPEAVSSGPAIQDDPKYQPYLKMLKMGVPQQAVKHKMAKDGIDPAILDMDPTKPPASSTSTKSSSSKKPKRPRRQTKKLHWDALPEDRLHANTIWASETSGIGGIDGTDGFAFGGDMMSEMENLFVKSTKTPSPRSRRKRLLGRRRGGNGDGSTGGKVRITEPKRARNVAITLARIKTPFEKLRDGLRCMHLPDLTTEQLGVLQTVLPDESERRAIRSYSGDLSLLEPCDRFFKIISEVENADDRLACVLCIRQFPGQVEELLLKVDCISQTCNDIRLSPMLKVVLEVALRIGNQLNRLEHGTDGGIESAGGIRAFSLRSLVKLSQTKSYDKKTTILHVIAKYALLKRKEKLEPEKDASGSSDLEPVPASGSTSTQESLDLFTPEIPHLEQAMRLPLSSLKQEGMVLRRELQAVLNELRGAPIMDPIWGPIRAFAASARTQLEAVDKRIQKACVEYEELVDFFAEDPDLKNDEFFSILFSFARSFKKALEDNERTEAEERRRARLKKEEEAKRARRAAKKKKTKATAVGRDSEALLGGSGNVDGAGARKNVEDPNVQNDDQEKDTRPASPERNEFGRMLTPREQLLSAIMKRKKG